MIINGDFRVLFFKQKNIVVLVLLFLSLIQTISAEKQLNDVQLSIDSFNPVDSLQSYILEELERVILDINQDVNLDLEAKKLFKVVIGTAENNELIAEFLSKGSLTIPNSVEGYTIRLFSDSNSINEMIMVIAANDSRGLLYALRDLEHYEKSNFFVKDKNIYVHEFERSDYPRIEHRGHWVWGCNMPDKKAWMENMSRWKLNELIHWDNFPPKKSKEYVDFAHSRGIRVVWGFGWGWNPHWNFEMPAEFDYGVGDGVPMCGSSPFNQTFLRDEILRKVRDEYVPSGCDGIYFQSFTEAAKCQCELCAKKSMGKIMLDFVNPIVDAIKSEFPDLWISCGIHANFGIYDELKDLDPRCNIYWENCPPGTSIRGEKEDFGYINKTLPYGHGFAIDCLADPLYTEASLSKWINSNAHRYTIPGGYREYTNYFSSLQSWAKVLTKKPLAQKHATTVADHSVFCRRTPFMHVALAEALWNPDSDTQKTATEIISVLREEGQLSPGFGLDKKNSESKISKVQHDGIYSKVTSNQNNISFKNKDNLQILLDGGYSSQNRKRNPAWLQFNGDVSFLVDLKKKLSINSLAVGFLNSSIKKDALPISIKFSVSSDGVNYKVIKILEANRLKKLSPRRRDVVLLGGLDLYEIHYIRYEILNNKQGLWIDELMVNPVLIGSITNE